MVSCHVCFFDLTSVNVPMSALLEFPQAHARIAKTKINYKKPNLPLEIKPMSLTVRLWPQSGWNDGQINSHFCIGVLHHSLWQTQMAFNWNSNDRRYYRRSFRCQALNHQLSNWSLVWACVTFNGHILSTNIYHTPIRKCPLQKGELVCHR